MLEAPAVPVAAEVLAALALAPEARRTTIAADGGEKRRCAGTPGQPVSGGTRDRISPMYISCRV